MDSKFAAASLEQLQRMQTLLTTAMFNSNLKLLSDRQYQDDYSSRNWGSWSQVITLDAKSGYHDIGAGVEVG